MMDTKREDRSQRLRSSVTLSAAVLSILGAGVVGFMLAESAPAASEVPAGQTLAKVLPSPPADGVMGFVVQDFAVPLVPGMDACPKGTAPRLKEIYLRTLPQAEQDRLRLKANEKELTDRWHAYALGPDNTNICSQPDRFQHASFPIVESRFGLGINLDGDTSGKGSASTCAHENFRSPTGEPGIDNQEYRAMGCSLDIRGADGEGGDSLTGMKQFHTSGEWTQVILLRGVDSLRNDPDVEVIYANTADRPEVDTKGNFLRGVSFTVSDKGARHRNALHGRIVDGVLTTDPGDIRLAQTWGQGGARDIRGNRTQYHFQQGRLQLQFQPDGTLSGVVGGYRPLFDVIVSPSLGGAGAALAAGIDCAAMLSTLKQEADGMPDPKTGKCTAVSSAMRVMAVPAYVTDLPAATRTASR